ncbi:MAG: DUF4277 domain-containing protein [Candidatus Electrothrix sp. AX1]|nr:DUF4277 domain-containing protein [Candidatus Electrothrix sp. AX1]
MDHLGIVAGTIKDLGLVELIDSHLGHYEDETLSVGETVAGMILNGLGFSNKPLSLTPLFFQNCPLSLLFREGVNADDFNHGKRMTFSINSEKYCLLVIVPGCAGKSYVRPAEENQGQEYKQYTK